MNSRWPLPSVKCMNMGAYDRHRICATVAACFCVISDFCVIVFEAVVLLVSFFVLALVTFKSAQRLNQMPAAYKSQRTTHQLIYRHHSKSYHKPVIRSFVHTERIQRAHMHTQTHTRNQRNSVTKERKTNERSRSRYSKPVRTANERVRTLACKWKLISNTSALSSQCSM